MYQALCKRLTNANLKLANICKQCAYQKVSLGRRQEIGCS